MASTNVGSLDVRLGLNTTGFTQGLNQANQRLTSFGNAATKAGQSLTLKLTAPLALFGRQAVKTANEFEASLGKISGLVGVATDEVAQMGDAARSMSVNFGKSAGEAADALFYITSAGLRGGDAMAVLEQSMKASAIGLGSTATVADLATSAVNAYGIANLSASAATDTMVATIREGKLAPEELAQSMGRVLPLASAMGVSFNEVGAAFAALSRTGTNAAEAATQIRGILASILRPTRIAEEALKGMGLSSDFLRSKIQDEGLLPTLGLLAEKFGDNEEASALVFGNIRALSGVLDLMGANVETTRQIFANMADNLGDTDKALESFSNTASFKMSVATAKMKDALLSIGQAIVPVLVPVFATFAKAIKALGDLFQAIPTPVKSFIVVVAGLAAALGPVLVLLGGLAKAMAAVGVASAIAAGTSGTAGVGAFTLGLSKMIPLLTNPAFLGAAVVVGGIGYAIARLATETDKAQERQERLTEAMRAAGDPVVTLIDNVKELALAYADVSESAQTAADSITEVDVAFVSNELSAMDVLDSVKVVGINIDELAKIVSAGEDTFLDLAETLKQVPVSEYAEQLRYAAEEGVPFVDQLLAQLEAGQLNEQQVLAQIEAFDALAVAYQDHFIQVEANAKALLTAGDSLARYSELLGGQYFIALRDAMVAQAEATGSLTPYLDVLAMIEPRARRVEVSASGMGSRLNYVGQTAFTATGRIQDLDEVLALVRQESEDGAASLEAFAKKANLVADFMANDLQLALLDASRSANDLYNELANNATSFADVETATRTAAKQIAQLVVETTNLGGETKDALPSIARIITALYAGAEAADVGREEVAGLIERITFLDELSPEISLLLRLDTTQLKGQVAQLEQAIATAKRIGNFAMLGSLTRELETVSNLLNAIGDFTPTGGGGGGRGGSTNDPFSWVSDWVSSVADTANDLISRDFGKMLVEGSADDVRDALANLLEAAADLGLETLPGFDALLGSIASKFETLAAAAERRGLLTEEVEDATNALKTLQRQIEDVREAQEDWLVSTKQKSPTLSLIEQALEAQREYERLYSNAEELRGQRQAFAGEITAGVMAPLQAGKSALGQTSRVLADARKFRDNLMALRDRGFGGDVLREVVNAGVVDGNRIAKSLLSMSEADMATFAQMRQEIATIGAQTGAFVADVVFGADVSEAERKLDQQRVLVNQLFTQALAEAEEKAKRQEIVVAKLNDKLAGTEAAIRDLTHAIQVDLYNTFFGFLAGFQNGLDQLGKAPARIPALASGGVVTRPTVALVGEAGAEAIVPLDRMGQVGSGDVYITLVVEGSVTSERDLVETIRKGLLAAQKSGRSVLL